MPPRAKKSKVPPGNRNKVRFVNTELAPFEEDRFPGPSATQSDPDTLDGLDGMLHLSITDPVARPILRPSANDDSPQTSESTVVDDFVDNDDDDLDDAESRPFLESILNNTSLLSFEKRSAMSLYGLVCEVTPEVPDVYTQDATGLTHTRGPSTYDHDLSDSEQLEKVVFTPQFMDQAEARLKPLLKKIIVDPSTTCGLILMIILLPMFTSRALPRKMCSEHDYEDWAWNVLVRPALMALKELLALFPELIPGNEPFDLTAGIHKGASTIPDGILTLAGLIMATIEIKSHHALKAKAFDTFSELYNLQEPPAIKFVWPRKKTTTTDKSKGTDNTKDTDTVEDADNKKNKAKKDKSLKNSSNKSSVKSSNEAPEAALDEVPDDSPEYADIVRPHEATLFVQVWSQLTEKDRPLGSLSSYEASLFFIRDKANKTLYVSRLYRRNNRPMLAYLAFIALALGTIPLDAIKLPPIKTDHWQEGEIFGFHEGFAASSFPKGVLDRAAARAAKSAT